MPTQTRHLAAIMFTDIAGYTKLMGENEQQALQLLRKNRNLHKSIIKKYNGNWLKEMGDGTLASFTTTSDAVYCAGELMDACKAEDIALRIGIHQGEVTMENGDIFGDGVNVASRIEPLAESGQILVSEPIHRNIKNKEGINSTFVKEVELKNVDEPIKVYDLKILEIGIKIGHSLKLKNSKKSPQLNRLLLALAGCLVLISLGLLIYFNPLSEPKSATGLSNESDSFNSIAVLPFEDLSPEGDQEYLGDGISEEIINVLTKINGLKVIGRTSSFSFKEQNVDLMTIGEKLGVGTLLEGSVKKSANKIRITAQLINATDGSHFWSETYNRNLEDIFVVQDEISRQIADKFQLTVTLSREEDPPTRNIDAYELYLRGRHLVNQGIVGAKMGVDYLEKAIELDPEFLKAYSALSETYWALGFYGLANPAEANTKAKNIALKEININPNSFLGYRDLSWINFVVEWDWSTTIENFDKAVELGLPLPDQYNSYYQSAIYGEMEKSLRGIQELLKDDPLSIDLLLDLSRMYLHARSFEDAINNSKNVLELSPENSSAKRHLADAYLFSGDYSNAMKYYGELLSKDSTYTPQGYIGALKETGQIEQAWKIFNQLSHTLTSAKRAMCYMHLEELDSAFKYMDKALIDRDPYMPFLKVEPHFDLMKKDPRYLDLLQKMNFPKN